MSDFAYLSGGRLFVQLAGDEPRAVDSPFAESIARRAASISRRNDWKTQGRGARFQMGMEGLPEELLEPRLAGSAVTYTGLSRGRHPAELMYTLSSGMVSGIFAFAGGEEERLFHGADVAVSEPCCEPAGERVACVARGKDGQSHIAIFVPGRVGIDVVTAGDALDSAPAWIPSGDRVVFESRALGYDRGGQVVDLAPAVICELDLKAATTNVLVSQEGVSCSSPRVSSSGALYYLRRPIPAPRLHTGRLLLDVLLFPLRIAMAIFHWFNVFSLRYTGKPLATGRSSRAKQADIKRAAVIGNLTHAAADARDEDDEPKTPKDWQLVARRGSGEETVIARGVVCFDLCTDESVIWSDGRSIFHQKPSARDVTLTKVKDVSELRALA